MSLSATRRRASRFIVLLLLLLPILVIVSATVQLEAEATGQETSQAPPNEYVDLSYLANHLLEFENRSVTTNGTVRFYASIYMFEDCWLEAQDTAKIMVVTRLSGLSVPVNGSLIEVSGTIEHSNLEGGFNFLNASAWKIATTPEFSTVMMLLVVLVLSAAVLLLKRKNTKKYAEQQFWKQGNKFC